MEKIDKYEINQNYYYDADSHFWVDLSGSEARIGMSPLVQETSGSFVAVVFDAMGADVKRGQSFGNIEAEKHVGPLNAPVSGVVTEINEKVQENPRLINTDPYGEGWLVKLKLTNKDEEIPKLIFGDDNIVGWFKSELKKFEDKGWIAQ
ncbi:MAG: glycine cleavage system protein H [Cyclobacteriaceae bacterium]|nr:glycine cleavage system protein H [Cyclobacteriaceae bacterium]